MQNNFEVEIFFMKPYANHKKDHSLVLKHSFLNGLLTMTCWA